MGLRRLEKRRIGQTDLEITTLGLGSASLAGIFTPVPSDQARATLAHGVDSGINYVDTAPQYGLGLSEHLVGEALRERATRPIISTKVGRLLRTPTNLACIGQGIFGCIPWGMLLTFLNDYLAQEKGLSVQGATTVRERGGVSA